MSKLETNTIDTISGSTTLTLGGTNANAITIPSGVTLTNNGTQAGLTLSDNILFNTASKGIYLGVTSATASNLLDDYEEGTFTPAFTGTTGAPSGVTYFTRNGRYIKIGRQVSVSMWLDLQSWSSGPTGTAIIAGLPFAAANVSEGYHAFHIGYTSGFSSTNAPQTGFIQANTTTILLYKNSTSDARDNLASDVQASSMTGIEAIIISGTYFTG
jgi:hypothetical protein